MLYPQFKLLACAYAGLAPGATDTLVLNDWLKLIKYLSPEQYIQLLQTLSRPQWRQLPSARSALVYMLITINKVALARGFITEPKSPYSEDLLQLAMMILPPDQLANCLALWEKNTPELPSALWLRAYVASVPTEKSLLGDERLQIFPKLTDNDQEAILRDLVEYKFYRTATGLAKSTAPQSPLLRDVQLLTALNEKKLVYLATELQRSQSFSRTERLCQAQLLVDAGHYNRALVILGTPDEQDFWLRETVLRAQLLTQLLPYSAVQYLEHQIRTHGDLPDFLNSLITAYLSCDLTKKAELILQHLQKNHSGHVLTFFSQAQVLNHHGNKHQALEKTVQGLGYYRHSLELQHLYVKTALSLGVPLDYSLLELELWPTSWLSEFQRYPQNIERISDLIEKRHDPKYVQFLKKL